MAGFRADGCHLSEKARHDMLPPLADAWLHCRGDKDVYGTFGDVA
jgi:hypothetical protein